MTPVVTCVNSVSDSLSCRGLTASAQLLTIKIYEFIKRPEHQVKWKKSLQLKLLCLQLCNETDS